MFKSFSEYWADLDPKRKRMSVIVAVIAIVLVSAVVFKRPPHRALSRASQDAVAKDAVKVIAGVRKDETLPDMAAKIDALSREVVAVRKDNEQLKQQQQNAQKSDDDKSADLLKKITDAQEDTRVIKAGMLPGGDGRGVKLPALPDLAPPPQADMLPDPQGKAAEMKPAPARVAKLRIFGMDTSEGNAAPADKGANMPNSSAGAQPARSAQNRLSVKGGSSSDVAKDAMDKQYLPAGSIIDGILLSGMDAPTASIAAKSPVPTLIRIKKEAILPNRHVYDVKECFVIASGFGELSSERVKLRTETISCVLQDNSVIETKMDGYVVGEDGKVGLRGRLVTKQGSLIAKSLFAGIAGGLSQGMAPFSVPGLNLNPGGTPGYQQPDIGHVAETGVYKGIGTSANEVAKFYLEMAKEMHPVLELDAMRKVTIILVHGASLAFTKAK